MATAETVDLGPPHSPKDESIKVFNDIEIELKKTLQHLRHETAKHEPSYFAAVENLSDKQLTHFSADNLVEVRVATSAYGMHLFGKVLLPESEKNAPAYDLPENPLTPLAPAYFIFRAFIAGETVKLHCIHMEEIEEPDGGKVFRAIFHKDDPLEWFDT